MKHGNGGFGFAGRLLGKTAAGEYQRRNKVWMFVNAKIDPCDMEIRDRLGLSGQNENMRAGYFLPVRKNMGFVIQHVFLKSSMVLSTAV